MTDRSFLRHRAEHAIFRGVSGVLRLLPRGSAAAFGRLLGRLFFAVARSRRRILEENLAAAFPEKSREEREQLAREVVDRFGATFMEFVESSEFTREEIEERLSNDGG